MCRADERTHKHHIIPRYMGGSDTPENLVEVTVTQHAMFHFCNYQLWGNEEDRLAWRGLSGLITPDEVALEVMSLGRRRGIQTQVENNLGIFGRSPEKMSEDAKKAGKIGGSITYKKAIGVHGRSPEKMSEDGKKAGKIGGSKGGKVVSTQKWQCTETGYISHAGGLTCYQNKRGIDTSKRIKVNGPKSWKITFEDGKVIVTTQTLKDFSEENDYSYKCLISVRGGRIKNHKGIIKIICL